MKNTGIVRRVDDLGRIVIPKEIRRRIRIKEGESLALYVEDEAVVFRKFSPIGALGDVRHLLVGLHGAVKCPVCICDRDRIIDSYKLPKGTATDAPIHEGIYALMKKRSAVAYSSGSAKIFPFDGTQVHALAIQPIISEGELFGAVILLSAKSSAEYADEKTIVCAKMTADAIAALLEI